MAAVLDEALLLAYTEEYLDQLGRLAVVTGAEIRDAFLSLEHLDRADVAEFVRNAKPILRAGRAEAIDLTSGYLAEATGSRLGVIDLRDTPIPFTDPFKRHWHDLKEGYGWDHSRRAGAEQADSLGVDHVHRGATDRMTNPGAKVRGYRRVISSGACEFCQVAATQLYRSAESASFGHGRHHKCNCKVVAVPFGADPGFALNKARLKELKASGAVKRVSAAKTRRSARASSR